MRAVARFVFGLPLILGGVSVCSVDSWQGWIVPIVLWWCGDKLAEYGYTGRFYGRQSKQRGENDT